VDTAFQFVTKNDGTFVSTEWANPQYVSSVYDAQRRSQVIAIDGLTYAVHGRDFRGGGAPSGYDYNVTGMKTMSAWAKTDGDGEFIVTIQTSAGTRALQYCFYSTSNDAVPFQYTDSNTRAYFGSVLRSDGKWSRIERNLAQDAAAAWPGVTLTSIRGMTFAAYSVNDLLVNDVRFSNSVTVEQNVLGKANIAHVLRNRTLLPLADAYSDAWFQYDRVGSVMEGQG